METKTHYFWALRLPDHAIQSIHDQLTTVKSFFPFNRWVYKGDYHITFAFLGSAEPKKLNLTIDVVDKAIKEVEAFPLHINQLGVFGKQSDPRIFWADILNEEQLYSLQSLVFKACLKAGFSLETRPFTPHITLARNWKGEEFKRQWLEEYNPFKNNIISFLANEVVLYRTNLGELPKYEMIANVLLPVGID